MNKILLTVEEANALKRVASHLVISDDMRADLIKNGVVQQLLGGLSVTQQGKEYLQGRR